MPGRRSSLYRWADPLRVEDLRRNVHLHNRRCFLRPHSPRVPCSSRVPPSIWSRAGRPPGVAGENFLYVFQGGPERAARAADRARAAASLGARPPALPSARRLARNLGAPKPR